MKLQETRYPKDQLNGGKGYCPTGSFEIGKATTNSTDNLNANGGCSGTRTKSENFKIAKVFYPIKSEAQTPQAIKRFCNEYVLGRKRKNVGNKDPNRKKGNKDVKTCYNNIVKKYGWDYEFCTAMTVKIDKTDPELCKTTKECIVCLNDIQDFGWQFAKDKYTNQQVDKAPCVKLASLKDDDGNFITVLPPCVRGMYLQYEEKPNKWVTYLALPAGKRLCPGSGQFTQVSDGPLFQYPIRFIQCGKDINGLSCPEEDEKKKCDADEGFKVSVNITRRADNPEASLVELISEGDALICDPAKFPGKPFECIEQTIANFKDCQSCGGCPK